MMVGMAATGLPELDVARVVKYCVSRVPDRLRHEIRVECDIAASCDDLRMPAAVA